MVDGQNGYIIYFTSVALFWVVRYESALICDNL